MRTYGLAITPTLSGGATVLLRDNATDEVWRVPISPSVWRKARKLHYGVWQNAANAPTWATIIVKGLSLDPAPYNFNGITHTQLRGLYAYVMDYVTTGCPRWLYALLKPILTHKETLRCLQHNA